MAGRTSGSGSGSSSGRGSGGSSSSSSRKVVKKINKAASKIPGFNSKVTEGRAAKRYENIMFHSKVTDMRKKAAKNPGGHLMWDKKPGSTAFPKKGKKR